MDTDRNFKQVSLFSVLFLFFFYSFGTSHGFSGNDLIG